MPSLFTDVYLLTSVSSLHPGHVTEGVSTNQHTNVSSGSCRLKRFRMSRLLLFCCFTCVCLGVDVRQSVSDLLTNPGDKVQIFCSHDKTDYTVMLWYQRSPADTAMKLVGYLNYQEVTMEEEYKQNFNLSGDLSGTKAKNGSLMIHITGREEGAVYYCGAVGTAYFGSGTKLTVLETGLNVTRPTVTLLPPSSRECRNQKDQIRKKTIVCVASGFYPDHVSVSWEVNGQKVTDGVATDGAALRAEGRLYRISSRLRVSAEDWFRPDSDFTCIISFFNGTSTELYSASLQGEAAAATEVMSRETYLRITQAAKLSYGVFILKSVVYGAFVIFLAWKLQGWTGKQNL